MSVLKVTAEQIHSIDSAGQFVELLRRLLLAEARANEIARSGVSVSAQITVSDGGEDGRIEWQDGPPQTDYLPARLTMFQAKATSMPRNACATEVKQEDGALKPAIRETLERGGAYIVFCTDKCGPKQYNERMLGIRDGISKATNNSFSTAQVDFYDANKISTWVNEYTTVAVWVLAEVLHRPVGALQSWESWSRNPDLDAEQYAFVSGRSEDGTVDLAQIPLTVRDHLARPRSVARIVGLSGLGKTRVALETFRPSYDRSDISSDATSISVVYTNSNAGSDYLVRMCHDLRREQLPGILVVDDCDIDLHRSLARIVEHTDSSLSLLTLDFDPTTVDGELYYIKLSPLDDEAIKGILTQAYQSLPETEIRRICSFAQGFPRMAVLLGDASLSEEGRVNTLRDDAVLRRLVWGRRAEDDTGQRVLSGSSLFDVLGVDGQRRSELEFVAEHVCGVDWRRCYEWLEHFRERQIVQRRGDFVQVLPKPLALRLAGEFWQRLPPDIVQSWFAGAMPERLQHALCDQLALLDFHPSARAIVETLCGAEGPFAKPEVLNTEAGSRCFRSLVETNPHATMATLVRAFGSASRGDLAGLTAGRRNLVWALEKLVFRKDTFADAARLLLAFAVDENEEWGNNATNQFVHLYQLHLSGTEADGEEKLAVIDEALASGVPREVEIAIEALGHGLTTHHFMRMGGNEVQGTTTRLTDWRPNRREAYHYYREVLSRLVVLATGNGQFAHSARGKIAPNLRGLIGAGLIKEIDRSIDRIVAAHGPYWPEALEAIADTLHFDRDRLHPEIVAKTETLHDRLLPQSLDDRLSFYVSELPWGFLRHSDTEDDDERVIVELAEECADQPELLLEKLATLLTGPQRQFFPFGKRLGEVFPDPGRFIEQCLSVLEDEDNPNVNAALLGAFIKGVEPSKPSLVEQTLETVASRPALHRYLVDLTRFTNIKPADIQRIINALRSGNIEHRQVQILAYGSVLKPVPAAEVDELIEMLMEPRGEALWTALEIAYFFVHGKPDHYTALRPRILQILLQPGMLTAGRRSNLDAHHFEDFGKKLLTDGGDSSELARHLSSEIVEICRLTPFPYSLDHLIGTLLHVLLEHHADTAWPVFEEAIENADSLVRFHLDHILGSKRAFDESTGPLFILSDKFLLEWCRRQHRAPVFLARCMPLLENNDNGTPRWTALASSVVDEFGHREDVMTALSGNMGSFGAVGSLVSYYERFEAPLRELASHRKDAVRKFAKEELDSITQLINRERKRDEEQKFGIY
ncbi:hypothetical protein T8K17_26075 (plasmid) [Thalassobaculum sp. OXR-137]|uniref:hypothetical protein n=1 Tax=Thalassobaculum sp. OXR-137 TaxID=3100173 RepID=UPI002AC8BF84|nr:hypothetical protein [Thalassobaculum sp. OXR-137]WPZ37192.1 hypothetical protein T8K17_26075 [Thalassobaculum sp. OXR-137]